MNIVFFWTWLFSKNILSDLFFNYKTINIVSVVSQPDKPFWRKQELIPTPIKEFALNNNLNIFQPEKLNNNFEFFNHLKLLNIDFIIVVSYWKIIPIEILEIPRYWCINIHWSILPAYRWASPIQESLKNWDKETWLTIMYMSAWMDEWDILKIEKINIDILDKTQDIFKKFENIWPKLLVDTLNWIISWEIKWNPQDSSKATYCKKINKEDWKIDFKNETVLNIYNKFRAYFPWPWVYTYFKGKKFDLTDIFFEENKLIFNKNLNLWDVIKFENNWKNSIWILCNWWILILNKVKLEWKKEMNINDFINWNKDFLNYNFC